MVTVPRVTGQVSLPAVLVTGGAKRLGAAIAKAFGHNGWHVIIHFCGSKHEAEALAGDLPSAETVAFDLSKPGECLLEMERLSRRLVDWRAMINCASVFQLDCADGIKPSVFSSALRINAETPTRMSQIFLKRAQSASGRRLIQITDQKIANPNPDFFSYSMSKQAFASTVPMLDMALSSGRDRVYAIAPGAILASHDQTDAEAEISHRMNLLHSRTHADDIAQTALFLSEGWLAGGQTVYVDSGQHLIRQSRDVLFLARQDRN